MISNVLRKKERKKKRRKINKSLLTYLIELVSFGPYKSVINQAHPREGVNNKKVFLYFLQTFSSAGMINVFHLIDALQLDRVSYKLKINWDQVIDS